MKDENNCKLVTYHKDGFPTYENVKIFKVFGDRTIIRCSFENKGEIICINDTYKRSGNKNLGIVDNTRLTNYSVSLSEIKDIESKINKLESKINELEHFLNKILNVDKELSRDKIFEIIKDSDHQAIDIIEHIKHKEYDVFDYDLRMSPSISSVLINNKEVLKPGAANKKVGLCHLTDQIPYAIEQNTIKLGYEKSKLMHFQIYYNENIGNH